MSKLLKCAASPCKSCPYRRDAPVGLWAPHEYEKLPGYDGDIPDQLMAGAHGRFDCHQRDGNLCAGWVSTHGAGNLLALRLQADKVDPSVWDYQSPVPVFSTGQEAHDHGVGEPDARASRMMKRLVKKIRSAKR